MYKNVDPNFGATDPLTNNRRYDTIAESEAKIAQDAPWALKTLFKKDAMDLAEAFGLDKFMEEN